MSWFQTQFAGITNQLTGYPYTAGAVVATALPMFAAMNPEIGRVLATVPRFVYTGAAGYAVGAIAQDTDCAVLKGVAGGILAETAMMIIM